MSSSHPDSPVYESKAVTSRLLADCKTPVIVKAPFVKSLSLGFIELVREDGEVNLIVIGVAKLVKLYLVVPSKIASSKAGKQIDSKEESLRMPQLRDPNTREGIDMVSAISLGVVISKLAWLAFWKSIVNTPDWLGVSSNLARDTMIELGSFESGAVAKASDGSEKKPPAFTKEVMI